MLKRIFREKLCSKLISSRLRYSSVAPKLSLKKDLESLLLTPINAAEWLVNAEKNDTLVQTVSKLTEKKRSSLFLSLISLISSLAPKDLPDRNGLINAVILVVKTFNAPSSFETAYEALIPLPQHVLSLRDHESILYALLSATSDPYTLLSKASENIKWNFVKFPKFSALFSQIASSKIPPAAVPFFEWLNINCAEVASLEFGAKFIEEVFSKGDHWAVNLLGRTVSRKMNLFAFNRHASGVLKRYIELLDPVRRKRKLDFYVLHLKDMIDDNRMCDLNFFSILDMLKLANLSHINRLSSIFSQVSPFEIVKCRFSDVLIENIIYRTEHKEQIIRNLLNNKPGDLMLGYSNMRRIVLQILRMPSLMVKEEIFCAAETDLEFKLQTKKLVGLYNRKKEENGEEALRTYLNFGQVESLVKYKN